MHKTYMKFYIFISVGITEKFVYVDIKTLHVQRNSTFPEKQGVNMTFKVELLNIDGAMDWLRES